MMLRLKQCSHMLPTLCLRRAQLGWKVSRKGAKLQHVRADSDFHVHQMASNVEWIWIALGATSAQHNRNQLAPTWTLQLDPKQRRLGRPSLAKLGVFWGQPAATCFQPETILGSQCERLKMCMLTAISSVFCFDVGSCVAMLPALGLPLGPNFGASMLSPTCAQTCPSCAMLDLSWASAGPSLGASRKFGPSWAQGSSCSV